MPTRDRRWRSVDLGLLPVVLIADSYRVRCPEHDVVPRYVPWARPASRFTRAFEDMTAWLTTRCDKTTVSQFMRTSWRSVGGIVARVCSGQPNPLDRAPLTRIGIDEISYRKGHRYLTVVVNHDNGRLVWAAPGRTKETVHQFFDALGPDRCRQITHVTRDAAEWISGVVADRCPNATQCMDPFHVVQWATQAVDAVRRETWRALKQDPAPLDARAIKHSRWALLKNNEDLSLSQRAKLCSIQRDFRHLYRAYLLKEQLRLVFRLPLQDALRHLDRWLIWARRSRVPQFSKIASTITSQLDAIRDSLRYRLSNSRVEAVNTSIRLIARKAYGFHSPQALISLALLTMGDLCPDLPGRDASPYMLLLSSAE